MKIDELVENVEYKCGDGICRKAVDGFFEVRTSSGEWTECYAPYNTIIGMEFEECEFEPMNGEDYYYPVFDDGDGYGFSVWRDDSVDSNIKKVAGVYRDREQAIEKARELGWIE